MGKVGGGGGCNVRPLYVDHDCEVLWPAGLFFDVHFGT